jgi:hypothetical protein
MTGRAFPFLSGLVGYPLNSCLVAQFAANKKARLFLRTWPRFTAIS